MISTSRWSPHQGALCRRAHLLTRATAFGWHQYRDLPGCCIRCGEHSAVASPLCREFLAAIPAITSEAHDVPVPQGRLF